ncbi:hypothetical protein K7432_011077 [Basidiobolus ranarum]|uniref:Uncharacterized protein n=1 Tax=Basidiobolus ranarum TaxID=34480 RepID=A0ABR2VUV2_9FUNG
MHINYLTLTLTALATSAIAQESIPSSVVSNVSSVVSSVTPSSSNSLGDPNPTQSSSVASAEPTNESSGTISPSSSGGLLPSTTPGSSARHLEVGHVSMVVAAIAGAIISQRL